MTYRGVVRDGKIELEDGVELPDGMVVRIDAPGPDEDPAGAIDEEAVDAGIPELAAQHDHYTYGTPKREG